jgi:CBS domain-containing protein
MTMKLKEIMSPDVEAVAPDVSLQQAARTMASLDVGFLPIVQGDELLGVITDRDMAVRAAARGLDPKHTEVRSIMTEAPICALDVQEVEEGARLMMDHRIRRLPIVDRNKKLVGIISLGDLSKTVTDVSLVARTLEQISEVGIPESRFRA